MEKFIEKMEALLVRKESLFKQVLVALTLVGLFFFFYAPCCLCWKSNEVISVYVTSGAWMLFAAWILWLIVLWVKEEEHQLWRDLADFLRYWGTDPFTRFDFVKFKYGKEFLSSDNEYKNSGKTLRNWLRDWMIEVYKTAHKWKKAQITYKKKW